MPLGLKERKKEGERYCHLGLSPSLLAKCQLSDLFQITHGERLLVGGEHLVELPSEPLGRGVAGGLQRREVAPARVAVALEHVRRRQLLAPLLATNLRNPFLAFGNWALVTAFQTNCIPLALFAYIISVQTSSFCQSFTYLRVMHPVIVGDLLALGDKSLGDDDHVAADVVPVCNQSRSWRLCSGGRGRGKERWWCFTWRCCRNSCG